MNILVFIITLLACGFGNTCGYQMFLATSVKKLEKYAKNERTYLYKTAT